MSTPTLESLLARFDTWIAAQPPAVEASLARPATKTAELPRALGVLLGWHDGERGPGGPFSALLLPVYEGMWRREVDGKCHVRFLGQRAARSLDQDVFVAGETASREPGPGAKAAKLVPFASLRADANVYQGADADDLDDDDGFGDDVDEWLLCVDSLQERVWLLQYPDDLDERERVVLQAPSLAAFLEPLLARLEGSASPAAEAKEDPDADATRTGKLLVALLLQQEVIELADDVGVDEVVARLESHLLKEPRDRAIDAVVAFFEDDRTIGEIYIDPEDLRAIVQEFI